ncbi:hypothetical protein N7522_007722 [Penicillium canescens]|uniref:endo-1,3(4)-beta-glucanase n=1 Tax=Penicillium canescens TaxID=5083 RepID=A0AAD6NAL3_PENCN|nr:uncharacterized protein N7446_003319 [Penicillium canescens]KAJ5996062.1 hypothetical protein N7522_007722 [Penicillium canescens]KAJ6045117.1 hypothetical protein N7460_006472 [Penicillium canescens]KAJ6056587.1 hypothetical protein N7444_005685 [Penicillium canescens]KAJ6075542.1 hypothetical protein N7446_003319 [Penicillium canescens]
MHVLSTLLPAVGLLAQLSAAKYSLKDDYGSTDSFFDKFNFFTDSDPTNGFVSYVDRDTASSGGLINASSSNGVYIGVDHSNTASDPGRQSVRLESTNTYTHGLVILDLAHMPGSACGTWPAFWMLGSDWPNNGEIDIIEGVNGQSSNQMTLHTSSGCSISNSGFTGTLETDDCYVDASGQTANAGCAIDNGNTQSFGSGFNDAGGGVYATEWTGSAINVWHFPSYSVPSDITSGNPVPSNWGTPAARFAGSCDINSHFKDLQIVFDITFCGDWAGDSSVWGQGSCAGKADTCDSYVQNNPSAFEDTYWSVKSLKVYQESSQLDIDVGINIDVDIDIGHGDGHGGGHGGGHGDKSRSSKQSTRDTAPYVRPGPRPSTKHRRDHYRRGHGHGHVHA